MRVAALLGRACVAGLWGVALGCTPREDLSSFVAGTRADPRPLQPAVQGAAPVPVEPAAISGGMQAAEGPAPQPSDTAPSSDGPAPPSSLAGGTETAAPAPSDSESSPDPEGDGSVAPDDEMSSAGETPASEPQPPVAPAPPRFRFVRLIADSDVTGGPLTSVAEFDVLGSNGQPLAHTGWVATADSAEAVYVGGAPAAMAIDGLDATMWHTPWFQVVPPPHPHFLELDLGQAQSVSGFRYLARQDGAPDGRIAAYRFFVSADGVEWGEPVVAGTLANADQPQEVRIPGH